MKRRAFTLVEILAVIGIIALLAAVVFPVFARARKRALEVPDISNMRQIYLAVTMYEADNAEDSPLTLVEVEPYVGSRDLFASNNDRWRTPMGNGLWSATPLIPCIFWYSPFKISFAYLRTFPPYNEDVSTWKPKRADAKVGMLASPYSGDVGSHGARDAYLCGDLGKEPSGSIGPVMEGPILRINMDGSFFRLPKNRNPMIGNPDDLFFNR
ncbi:MAG: hypothetical protein AMXMBFR19_10680 [Chthonomonadaceae bacterium]|uniref:Prepilin-type N-terminal cleavage/methylation domain-containing protein n=1 Tax=Candidatus Nitrosymbiomonas proteolyticus TaxID=2608984 RepID=A0A809RAL2_9BACT|nr:hypothetical protein [Fimbriimonadaceae bacterium]NUM38097.1 type II secretion system protein [Armatimonadota bacterium]QOJ13095.1 MAG: type II secretion system protein [Chthonomonadaceae bacterium]BBO24510.1 conserved hypothetical protein [Candidatus Nitrosymbiomonas proteolyticus]